MCICTVYVYVYHYATTSEIEYIFIDVNCLCLSVTELKPNSITLAGSKLVRSWSQTGLKLVGDQLRTSFEPASVMKFGFYYHSYS